MPRLLIAASGTGGHLFPAIAVAEELSKSWEITWLGVANRLETNLVPKEFVLKTIHVAGLQGSGLRKILQLFKLMIAIQDVARLIRTKQIQVVFTTGGYISAPAILAAKLCRKKVILHESNAFPGKATRLLGRFCDKVALGIPVAKEHLPNCKTIFTGTPVRKSFLTKQSLPSWVPAGEGPLLVVMGGSQGAVGLNRMVQPLLALLLKKGFRVVHLTGIHQAKTSQHPNLVEKVFTNEMAGLLQNADFAISRSGAGALNELAICALPAVLVPYPYATDNHQELNAAYAAQFGAALILHQQEPEHPGLINLVKPLIDYELGKPFDSNQLIKTMREGMNSLAADQVHENLVSLLEQFT